MVKKKSPTFLAKNLLDGYAKDSTAVFLADVFGVDRQCIYRWRNGKQRLSIFQADKFAIRIGLHPSQIWTEWYDEQ